MRNRVTRFPPPSSAGPARVADHLAAANELPQLFDRWGRPILVGGLYEFHPELSLQVSVKGVDAVRDLNAPPGLRRVVLACTVIMDVPNGATMPRLTMIAPPEEKEDTANPPADPPPGDPPTDPPPADPPAEPSLILQP